MKTIAILIGSSILCGCITVPKSRPPRVVLDAVSELGPGMTQNEVYDSLAKHGVCVGPMFGEIDGRIEMVIDFIDNWDVHLFFDPRLERLEIRQIGVPGLPFKTSIFTRNWRGEEILGGEGGDKPRWPSKDNGKPQQRNP